MKNIKREEIKDLNFIKIIKKESHHNHGIIQDEEGILYWKPDENLCAEIEGKNINDNIFYFHSNGLDKNSEEYRKFYRDMGYSLLGYWNIFYCKTNNPICTNYRKNCK
jgi:hypothetical protein